MEDLYRHLLAVIGETHHISPGVLGEHHGVAFPGLGKPSELVTQHCRPFEVQLRRGLEHLAFQLTNNLIELPRHETAETVCDLAVGLRANPADAGRGALSDITQQARPA